ncbi:MAG: 3-hydroxyacyl-CoA dehydrogenase family protein, partial [Bacteroidota bacterium]|nr:3-hydroxyacyl-CoA dehydrogenase family protein [Bacteroidota bacterium]
GIISKISGSLDYKNLEGCDLVIEAILSNNRHKAIEARKEIFINIEKHVSKDTIIATNSTTIAITELASVLEHKNRCVSMHVSLTSPEAKLIEVVKSIYTGEEVCRNVQKFAVLVGRIFIKTAESPGLITVRLFAPMVNEACDILLERVANLENIDFAAKKSLNLPLGPFEMADKIGIDRIVRWLENMYEEFGDMKYKASPILRRLDRSGQTGRKVCRGFYLYDDKGNKLKDKINPFIL